jgi:hypothetical protein
VWAASVATKRSVVGRSTRSLAIMKRLLPPVFAVAIGLSLNARADNLQDALFEKVVSAAKCQQTVNNGLICDYNVSEDLKLSIKDAGGSDTVIGFRKSNIDARLYAVMYFGCVAVVPGMAHPTGYSKDYGVFISPLNGRVYRTSAECRKAGK